MPKRVIKPVIRMVTLLALIGVSAPAHAIEPIREYVPQAQKVGEARMSVMFWDIYDASLYAPKGQWSFDKPFALQLHYLRHLDGEKIADRSVKEMRKQGFDNEVKLATWHTQMREIFPDVEEGDVLSGIFTKDGQSIFYQGEQEIGRIKDPDFSRRFFAIWLSPQTSAPELRTALLGREQQSGKKRGNHEITQRDRINGTDGIY